MNETQEGSGNQLGTEKYGADLSVRPLDGTTLFGGFYREAGSSNGHLRTWLISSELAA